MLLAGHRKISAAAVCFLAPVVIWAQQPALTPEGDLLRIEGRVVNTVSGAPVHGATVTLTDTVNQRAVNSDGNGRFLFENLKRGTYRLSAERTGFLRQEYGASLSISADQSVAGLVL